MRILRHRQPKPGRNLSYQYHNGLIDKEFYLRDDDNKLKAEFVAGNTGTYGLYLTNNTDAFEATLKNNPEAEFAVLPWLGVPEGNMPQGRADWPFGLIMGINHESTEEERRCMDVSRVDEPSGESDVPAERVEGENYTLDSDGLPVKTGFQGRIRTLRTITRTIGHL